MLFKLRFLFNHSKKCVSNYACKKEKENDESVKVEFIDPENKANRYIILDCSSIQFIDEMGVKTLKEIIKEYKKENIKLLLTNCNGKLDLKLKIYFLKLMLFRNNDRIFG